MVQELTATNMATKEMIDIKVMEDRDVNVQEGRPFNSVIIRCVPDGGEAHLRRAFEDLADADPGTIRTSWHHTA